MQADAQEHALKAHEISKSKQVAEATESYRPHTYKTGDRFWLSRRLFSDAYARAEASRKLTAQPFGLFTIERLVGRKKVKLAIPNGLKLHDVFHVTLTRPVVEQPPDIARRQPPPPEPVGQMSGEDL